MSMHAFNGNKMAARAGLPLNALSGKVTAFAYLKMLASASVRPTMSPDLWAMPWFLLLGGLWRREEGHRDLLDLPQG